MMQPYLERTGRPAGGAIDLEVLKRKSWTGFAAEYVRISAPASYNFRAPVSHSHVSLYNIYRIDGETIAGGLAPSYTKDLRNKLTFVPAGCDLQGWCSIDKVAVSTTVSVRPDNGHDDNDLSLLPPRIEFDDQMLRWAMLRFQAILNDPSRDVPGYAETLLELLSYDLHRVAAGRRGRDARHSGLSTSQVRIVTEYIEAHLFERPSIAELAELLDMTRFHFIRSFKTAVGVPPHQFMILRRVERAKELLTERGHTVADVAAQTGFSSPIQLTRAFRRVVGTTPSEFKRESP